MIFPTPKSDLSQLGNFHFSSKSMAAASSRAIILLSCLMIVMASFPSSTTCSRILSPTTDQQKISMGVYYESMCPWSANFVVNYLIDLFQDKELLSIVDLRLYPWGNTRIRDNGTIWCQHGLTECLLDTVEACVIDLWPKLEDHFPFIHCVESLVHEDYDKAEREWESCFQKLGLDEKSVLDCTQNGRGEELELKYAAETYALQPEKTYVPWVTVDGKPLHDDYGNYTTYICNAYKGSYVPKACGDLPSYGSQRNDVNPGVCNEEITMSTTYERLKSAIRSDVSIL